MIFFGVVAALAIVAAILWIKRLVEFSHALDRL